MIADRTMRVERAGEMRQIDGIECENLLPTHEIRRTVRLIHEI